MGVFRQIAAGVRSLLRRDATDRDIADEVQHYLSEAEDELIAGGASPEEAKRAVRLRFGDAGAVREDVRSHGWENTVETLSANLRYGARRLLRSPGFTTVAVLTLGLGVGASTTILSAVSAVLLEPLPYPDAERVVAVYDRSTSGARLPVTFGTYREIAERSRSFESLAVFKAWQPTLTGDGEPERLSGQRVSADYFRVLEVPPALGPGFVVADDRVAGPNVVILSDAVWRSRYGGDTTIVGRDVRLDDTPFTVVGVMPPTFTNVPGLPNQVWSLLQYDARLPTFDGREWGHHLDMVGRLLPGVEPEEALIELERIAETPLPALARPSWASMAEGFFVDGLKAAATSSARPALIAMLGAALLLLLIASVNVVNLLLARGARRHGELAMRAALGAARGRILGQLVSEGLLLASLGGALALGVAWLGVRALLVLSPPELPRVESIGVDGFALLFTLGVTTLIGIAVGLAPMLGARGVDLEHGVRKLSRRAAGGHVSTRRALVVAEVALALVLLVGAGLLLRSMRLLMAVPPGFDASGLLVMQVQTSGNEFRDEEVTRAFFAEALDAVRGVPGVTSAALTSQLPLGGQADVYGMNYEDAGEAVGEDGAAFRYAVSPGYFETMGIPLVDGRALDPDDVAGAPGAALINESFASRVFPGGSAVGRRVHVGRNDLPWYTVVGVVGDVKQASLAGQTEDAVYLTTDQWYFADRSLWFVVRTEREPASFAPALERAIWSVDPDQPIVQVATMADLVARSEAQRRFALLVLETFAVLALLLAGIGLYGVLAGSVGERMREMGVRAALGASEGRIVALVVRQGMALTFVGMAVGLVGAAAASKALGTLLYGVTPVDPVTYVAVASLLTVVSAVACWIPARRAMRVDPAMTLRAD